MSEAKSRLCGVPVRAKQTDSHTVRPAHRPERSRRKGCPYISNWGVALAKLGNDAEAIEKSKKAIELGPDLAYTWHYLARVYSLQNKKLEALQNLKKAIVLEKEAKEDIKKDEYLKNLWEDVDFKKLVE